MSIPYATTFRVDGIPKAQPRHRAFARKMGKKFVARVYDPGTAEAWKGAIALACRDFTPPTPIEGPIRVDIDLYFPRPKRLMRKSDPDGRIWHIAKPDRDNADKAVLDTLTALGWWRDDAQVCYGLVGKFYHAKTGKPGAWITVQEMMT